DMVPALVDAIKSHGLALVVDKSTADTNSSNIPPSADIFSVDPFPRLPKGVDGVLKRDGILKFNESIDV
ncbi:hypothetical protein QBC36DRAFT_201065, partial [Triangularia setosa]